MQLTFILINILSIPYYFIINMLDMDYPLSIAVFFSVTDPDVEADHEKITWMKIKVKKSIICPVSGVTLHRPAS